MSWLKQENEMWLRRTGYELPFGWYGRVKTRLMAEGKSERQIRQHLNEFLVRCPPEHISPGSFYKTFNRWSPAYQIDRELDQRGRQRERAARSRVDGGPGRPDPLLALRQHAEARKAAGRAGEKRGPASKG